MSALQAAEVSAEERWARLALNAITEPGDPRVARLVAEAGVLELHDRLSSDTDPTGLRTELAERLVRLQPGRVLDEAHRLGIRFVVPGDSEWPVGLAELDHVEPLNRLIGAPLGLWVTGPRRLSEVCARSVAVVGSRSATSYGTGVAGDLGAELAKAGYTVVSGAAYGIDQAAHRGALAVDGPTVAVLACGVDRAYPASHQALLNLIGAEGVVVSELPPGCSPTRVRFLSRNRLIAAMTQGTVVVEAAVRSGALNTANWAVRLGRPVMGVPGPVTSAPSEGVHELLRSGGAALVTRGDHVLEVLAPIGERLMAAPRAEARARDRLDAIQQRVLEAVPVVRSAPDVAIACTAGLAAATVGAALGELAELGWVRRVDDRWVQVGRSSP